jgi:hypothetical protein
MDPKSIEDAQTTGLLCISHLKKVYPFHTGPSSMVIWSHALPKSHQLGQLMILWLRDSFLTKTIAVALISTSCDWVGGILLMQRQYVMNGRSQIQGGKNWIFPKEINANRFLRGPRWVEIWKNHLCPSMGPNGGSVAMDSGRCMCVCKTIHPLPHLSACFTIMGHHFWQHWGVSFGRSCE